MENTSDVMAFLEQFNKKYSSEKAETQENKEDYRPTEPPDVAPCQWGYPCNGCGQC